MESAMRSHPIIYISHGGGPLPLLGDPRHKEMNHTLEHMAALIPKPSAILLVSAHWEEQSAVITGNDAPPLIYDYYGFPEESYAITYPAPGHPALAEKIHKNLAVQNIEAEISPKRGFDHGLFIPMKIMFPEASIPCVQVSLIKGLNPLDHIRLGKALKGIDQEELLIIGSGFSFHNIRAFFTPPTPETQTLNEAFENWLMETCANEGHTEDEREKRLCNWEQAPGARYCHPREEHLLPLHVCCGAAGRAADEVFAFDVMDRKASAYLWMPSE